MNCRVRLSFTQKDPMHNSHSNIYALRQHFCDSNRVCSYVELFLHSVLARLGKLMIFFNLDKLS